MAALADRAGRRPRRAVLFQRLRPGRRARSTRGRRGGCPMSARRELGALLDAWASAQAAASSENGAGEAREFEVVQLEEFAAVEEPGADPLVGDGDDALLAEDSDG